MFLGSLLVRRQRFLTKTTAIDTGYFEIAIFSTSEYQTMNPILLELEKRVRSIWENMDSFSTADRRRGEYEITLRQEIDELKAFFKQPNTEQAVAELLNHASD